MAGRPRSCVSSREHVLIALQVPAATRDDLQRIAAAAGVSMSALVRRFIRAAFVMLEAE